MKYIAIMGFGTIGRGVYDIACENSDILKKYIGDDVVVKHVLDLREFPGEPVESVLTHDVADIIDDPEVEVVVETMGGVEPAFSFEMRTISAGKHVVTSNKELVEAKGAELFENARAHSVNFFFEASVGGGIPIIRGINECLVADRIDEVSGILNGTTNYILTAMTVEGTSYETCLKNAQELGYAEKDPTADVEGHDAGRKIAILASMVTGKSVKFEDLTVEGISNIKTEDITYAKKLGYAIRLIASASVAEDGVTAMVAPRLVKPDNALYSVNDVFNAVTVHGNMVDSVMFYGRGAGSHATASAVVADVLEALKRCDETVYPGWSSERAAVKSTDSLAEQFFIRVSGTAEEVTAKSNKIFGGGELVEAGIAGECGFITPVMTEIEFKEKTAMLDGFIKSIRIK